MRFTFIRRPIIALAAIWIAVLALVIADPGGTTARAGHTPICGPMDVVLVIDDTGSMFGAIGNVVAGATSIVTQVDHASGADYQMGLVTFKDNPGILTREDLAAVNGAAVQADLAAIVASGGAGGPEASNTALDLVIQGSNVFTAQTFNSAGFRAGATKIVIMFTDNLPGGAGVDDVFEAGIDDVFANGVAVAASAAGILISTVYNANIPNPTIVGIMQNYATITGGSFTQTPGNGAGSADAISTIIAECGRGGPEIDIKPNSDPSSFGCKSKGSIPVAVLGSATFDATEIDADTVLFGKTGTETGEVHVKKGSAKEHVEDFNGDGFLDMIFHFKFPSTGFSCADIPAGDSSVTLVGTLAGELKDATPFSGTSDIRLTSG